MRKIVLINRSKSDISQTMPSRAHPRSKYAAEAARLLGARVRLGRRERGWSQAELAERIGITPRTLAKIEHGDLSVGLGAAFEAAALVGVPLFHAERSRLSEDLDLTAARSALLPRPTHDRADDDVADDF
jgi:transcriptional regulator with XRE-family HTH domain